MLNPMVFFVFAEWTWLMGYGIFENLNFRALFSPGGASRALGNFVHRVCHTALRGMNEKGAEL